MFKIEIERKFLVTGDSWRRAARSVSCQQGYILYGPPVSVRVRVIGEDALLTLKRSSAADAPGIERLEFEYPIPLAEGLKMLETLCQESRVEKTRHYVEHGAHTWEIDEFTGANAGLVVAEIELESAGEIFELPEWTGKEVSGDPRYLNVNLAQRPYTQWGKKHP